MKEEMLRQEKTGQWLDGCLISTRIVRKKDWCGDGEDKDTGTALVSLDVTLTNGTGRPVTGELLALIEPDNFEEGKQAEGKRTLVLQPGQTTVKLAVTVDQARLWWTWDHGFPHLYRLRLSWQEEEREYQFGIKEVAFDEKHGVCYLNGQKLFLRGALLLADCRDAEARLEEGRREGVNAAYLEGFREEENVYAFCDRQGILLWQTFLIPENIMETQRYDEFADRLSAMGRTVTNHAALGMWSVSGQTGSVPQRGSFQEPLGWNRMLEETLRAVCPVRILFTGEGRKKTAGVLPAPDESGQREKEDFRLPHIVLENAGMGTEYAKNMALYMRQKKYDPVCGMFFTCTGEEGDGERSLYNPVLVCAEPCLHPCDPGTRPVLPADSTFTARVWLINDTFGEIDGARLSWRVTDCSSGEILSRNSFRLDIMADSAEIPDHIVLPLRKEWSGRACRAELSVGTKEGTLSESALEFGIE